MLAVAIGNSHLLLGSVRMESLGGADAATAMAGGLIFGIIVLILSVVSLMRLLSTRMQLLVIFDPIR